MVAELIDSISDVTVQIRNDSAMLCRATGSLLKSENFPERRWSPRRAFNAVSSLS
jgi:hypothetical protein